MNQSYSKIKDNILFVYADEKMTMLHNENGYAIVWLSNNFGYHYLNNKYLNEKEFKEFQERNKEKTNVI